MGIELVPLHDIDSGGAFGYYARGDHQPEDFVAQVNREYGSEFDPSEVYQSYARAVPLPKGHHDYADIQVLFNQKKGRGAFFVTYVTYE